MRHYAGFLLALCLLSGAAGAEDGCADLLTNKKFGWSISPRSNEGSLINFLVSKSVSSGELVQVKNFFSAAGNEVVVGLNGDAGYYTQKFNSQGVEYLSGKTYADEKSVFYREAKSPDHALLLLTQIYKRSGPIKRLLIFGHGSPGAIEIGTGTINLFWDRRRSQRLNDLPQDLFAPGATIVLVSCECAAGYSFAPSYGSDALAKIFSALLKQGGQVIASRRKVRIDLGSQDDPSAAEIKNAGADYLRKLEPAQRYALVAGALPLLAALTVGEMFRPIWRDWTSLFRRGKAVVRIQIPPSAPNRPPLSGGGP